jgi:hypothetical protein
MAGVSFTVLEVGQLLDFAFLIHNVLASHWVVLFHFEFIRRGTLVFIRGIKMACTSGRVHSDLFSHDNSPLNLFAASAHIRQHLLNAQLIDDTHTLA